MVELTKEQKIANRKHNQEYLKLDDIEILLHEGLMKTPMNMLPQSLIDYLNREHKGDAVCGDALSCWIADWIRSLRKVDISTKYDDICNRVEAIHKGMIEFMRTVSIVDMQDPKVDKRCGTCGNYMQVSKGKVCSISFMEDDYGTKCPDWTGKSKEKRRVWTCLNCGEDISYDSESRYFHVRDDCIFCEVQSTKVAIPKPDSERWIDIDEKTS